MKHRNAIRILFVTLVALVLIGGALIYFALDKYQEIKTDPAKIFKTPNPVQSVEVPPTGTREPAASPSPVQAQKTVIIDGRQYVEKPDMLSILFLGIDTNRQRIIDRKGYRSDMIMICALDMKNGTATLISIPRDTYTQVCHVDEDTGKVLSKEMGRINSAYSYGGGKDKQSYPNAIRAVEHFMNIEEEFHLDIRYYAGIDIDGIARIASVLGGVSVTLEEGFPGIGSKGQTVTLRGEDAMNFVRERKNVGGDLGRTRRQQQFMMAIARKIQKLGAVKAAEKLYSQITGFMTTNFNLDEVVALASILDNMDVDKIRHVTVDGTASNDGAYYYHAKESSIRQIMLDAYYEPVAG